MLDLKTAPAILAHVDASVFTQAAAIVAREGGYVSDPGDPGGPTNHGVSLRLALESGLTFDLNDDGQVNADDIKLVTPQMAESEFVVEFFVTPGLSKTPLCLQPIEFDESVNAGASVAILLSQRVVNKLRHNTAALMRSVSANLTEDGKLGPMTVQALANVGDAISAPLMINTYVGLRVAYYHAIVAHNPAMGKFINGWVARANSFLVKV